MHESLQLAAQMRLALSNRFTTKWSGFTILKRKHIIQFAIVQSQVTCLRFN